MFNINDSQCSFTECNCHGHSDDCYYDEEVARSHRSLDMSGNYEGGGVCIDCQDHTAGINCELCEDGYYRQGDQDLTSPYVCEGEYTFCFKVDFPSHWSCPKLNHRDDIHPLPMLFSHWENLPHSVVIHWQLECSQVSFSLCMLSLFVFEKEDVKPRIQFHGERALNINGLPASARLPL